jgi:hypothetical protein
VQHGGLPLRITDSGFRWTAESDWRSEDQQ